MTDDIKPEVIKKTQDLLGKYFKKPPLTEKLLRKPPFRFLHDIISAIIKETGFLDGLFSVEELNSDNIKDKEAKLAFLTKLIDVVKLISGPNLTVKASKIISGQESTKTNELLQAIGKALDKKISSTEVIEHYKKNSEKKSKSGSKSKSSTSKEEPVKRSASRQSSQIRKVSEKEKTEVKKRSSSTGKVTNDTEAQDVKLSSIQSEHQQKDEDKRRNNEIIDVPPAEPVQEKVPSSAQRRKHSSSAKSKQSIASAATTSDLKRIDSAAVNSVKDKKDESTRRKESDSRSRHSLQNQGSESQDHVTSISESLLPLEIKSANHIDNDKIEFTEYKENKENEASISNELRQLNEKSDLSSSIPKSQVDFAEPSTSQGVPRPRTSLRPPTARPISARPAAPRMRAKTELIVNEEISTPIGNISVIIENSDAKDDDDDAEDMVVMETRDSAGDLPNESTYKIDSQLTQEHGHLVAQILETQRELVNTDNVDVLPKKVDIAWETGSKRDREAVAKEIDKLRTTIQTLTRTTNPLGKLLDYLQEDVDIMQKEFLDWRNQYNQLNEQLEKEKMQTQELIEPMKETLKEIDRNMKVQLDNICQVKSKIMKNDQKIQRLLNGL